MGEARRRKVLDPNYGNPKFKVVLRDDYTDEDLNRFFLGFFKMLEEGGTAFPVPITLINKKGDKGDAMVSVDMDKDEMWLSLPYYTKFNKLSEEEKNSILATTKKWLTKVKIKHLLPQFEKKMKEGTFGFVSYENPFPLQ